jgi:hypothetical protein
MLKEDEKFEIREQLYEIIKIVGIPEQVSLNYEKYYLETNYPDKPQATLDIQELVDMKPYISDDEGVVWILRYLDSQGKRNSTFFRRA